MRASETVSHTAFNEGGDSKKGKDGGASTNGTPDFIGARTQNRIKRGEVSFRNNVSGRRQRVCRDKVICMT